MKKSVSKLVVKPLAKACEKMAVSVSASACCWCTYQPKEPKVLRK